MELCIENAKNRPWVSQWQSLFLSEKQKSNSFGDEMKYIHSISERAEKRAAIFADS
jgi:hypothetical protein